MPEKPPSATTRSGYDRAYNAARAHRSDDRAIRSRRWQAVREMAMQRDGYLCQPCKREGLVVRAVDADHILPRRTHPDLTFDLSNVEAICRSCHNAKTRAERG